MADGLGPQLISTGRLLVANPMLPDPNFDRTVVLLLAYADEGALGVVLNRPSDTHVGDPLAPWEDLAAAPAVLFVGGPVQHQAVICLARPDQRTGTDAMEGFKAVTPEVGTLDLDLDPALVGASFRQVRIFAGYAGWSAGQLESEIEAGAWWVVDAEPGDPFSVDPANLWKHVLRRQRPPLGYVAYFPDDPADN
ncbi:MAG TPA: YqgE/AlgH family protein [Acidimicrobiales bacterium]|nr:YqgE/AlgH family protein [Acidimicrobiales bacterium]